MFAKLKLIFGRKPIPRTVPKRRRAQVAKTVQAELARAQQSSTSPGAVADTLLQIAKRERQRAIKRGAYGDAIVAAIIEQTIDDATKKKQETAPETGRYW